MYDSTEFSPRFLLHNLDFYFTFCFLSESIHVSRALCIFAMSINTKFKKGLFFSSTGAFLIREFRGLN